MKKYLIILITVLSLLIIPNVKAADVDLPEKTDHEKVKINLFWSSQCQHCHDFINYFKNRYVDYVDYFEIVGYQVNNNVDNSNLMKAVGIALGHDEKSLNGVPLIVIGEQNQRGFGSDGKELIEMALEEYQNADYKDLVNEVKKEESIEVESKNFSEVCSAAGVRCKKLGNSGLSDTAVIIIIFVIVIGGFAGLTIYSRKK